MGLGNILLGDEGLGVRALERLLVRYTLPAQVRAIDGGVMGLDLLHYLEGIDRLLVLDAVQTGRPPGSLVRLEGEEVPAALAVKMSMHQVGLQELLAVSRFRGTLPPGLVLWGMEPASLEPGLSLSDVVEARMDGLIEAVVEELHGWGVRLAARKGADGSKAEN
ncbi:MAG: HyaD/HybD family hydrogenase maturation endopeptidase [Chloroflexi bacterium]|nr:MAG: HyaD/HybD family hydrogenase maturation endopeptidase [Chloroflexota bacterium]